MTCARLLRRFQGLAEPLRDGRLCLTTLAMLRDVLSEDRLEQILERAAYKTSKQMELVVASLAPRPAPVRDSVRPLAPPGW